MGKHLRKEIDALTYRRVTRITRELHGRGLGLTDISVVLDLYEGIDVTHNQLKYISKKLGLRRQG